ncbi:hypothetical protein RB195_015544 [Necator americanus]|uniref:Ground-like domain-containing protein n=1 Tax=Necator americanus TaxID=51031 RepID=A0ABR1E5P7_NECAM
MLQLFALSALFVSTSQFFFGTGGGGCGCAPAPICPPAPICAPAPICPPPSCGGGGGGYVQAPPLPPPISQPISPPIVAPSYPIGGGGSYSPPLLPQSPVYTPPEQPSFPIQQGGPSYEQSAPPAQGYPPQEVQPIAPQQPAGGVYQQPAAGAYQQPAGGVYQQPPGELVGTLPVYQQQVQPQGAAYQGTSEVEPAAQRDSTQDLVNGLQQEAAAATATAAAAGSKNEEVLEEQDQALEKSGLEMTTAAPQGDGSTTVPIEVAEEKVVDISNLKLTDDPLCNSEDLRKLMLDNIDDNLNSSKRLIQLAAEAQFGGRFDVICANGDFSYVTNTELFCQETKGDISCYTYRQL